MGYRAMKKQVKSQATSEHYTLINFGTKKYIKLKGIISVLCFISIKDIINQHEGQLSAHLIIDMDIMPWK
jgi:hypothetical protein